MLRTTMTAALALTLLAGPAFAGGSGKTIVAVNALVATNGHGLLGAVLGKTVIGANVGVSSKGGLLGLLTGGGHGHGGGGCGC